MNKLRHAPLRYLHLLTVTLRYNLGVWATLETLLSDRFTVHVLPLDLPLLDLSL